MSGLLSFHSNLLFPPFVLCSSSTRFIQLLKLIKKFPVREGIRAGTTFWNEIPSCSSVTLTQLRGETDLSLITDPLVTIIKRLISDALRRSQSAALLTAACHSLCSSQSRCRCSVQGQSCMLAVLDCYWMCLCVTFKKQKRKQNVFCPFKATPIFSTCLF